jgi:hypothetical protein
VAELMVMVHEISPDLAAFHVSQMDLPELRRRVRLYVGMELSAVRSTNQSVSDFYQVFAHATTTAGRSALNCVPPEAWQFNPSPMPESEAKNLVRRRRRFLPSQDFAVPESEEKTWESRSERKPASGERAFGVGFFT